MQAASDIGTKLAKLTALLSSSHPGEIVAAVAAIDRTLGSAGLTWHDFASAVATGLRSTYMCESPPQSPSWSRPRPSAPPARSSREPRTRWQQAAMEILRVGLRTLAVEENQFLTGQLHWRGEPTPAQQRWLRALAARYSIEVENG